MFALRNHRLDFADTRIEPARTLASFAIPADDPLDQFAAAEAAERGLLRLVAGAAVATMLLALAATL